VREIVDVLLWGTRVGSLGYAPGESRYATFEYDPDFMESGIQIGPIRAHYPPARFTFHQAAFKSFQGLPGFIADSLPDRYGSQLIDVYMAGNGIPASEVTALDRLNYVADRGMGALEYRPGESLVLQRTALDLRHLAELAEQVLQNKARLQERLRDTEDHATALTMIRIGSSAGGARSKALVARSSTGKIFDGTVNHGPNYTYWLLKFDGGSNSDRDRTDPRGMPVLEYIYSRMAASAGISIPRTDLISDGTDRHFLIERFDRVVRDGTLDKRHYASWSGLDHADRDGVNSYEQLILLVRKMSLGQGAETEVFRRAVFNILGRNQDDHTKNVGFLMDRHGTWRLSPAFDLTYSYDPAGRFTKNHQCRLNEKNNEFDYSDLLDFGRFCNLSETKSRAIIEKVADAFSDFPALATELDLPRDLRRTVEGNLRLHVLS
jgi:serine/threonine-protein kinase HipA